MCQNNAAPLRWVFGSRVRSMRVRMEQFCPGSWRPDGHLQTWWWHWHLAEAVEGRRLMMAGMVGGKSI